MIGFQMLASMMASVVARRFTFGIGFGLLFCALAAAAAEPDEQHRPFPSKGHVLMIRHAYAPGSGDPAHFRIGECSTQRNLNDAGREQSLRIGRWLRSQGIHSARVYSSQWCRCLETAAGLDLGPVRELPALNSFFERPQDREPNLAALREFLSQQPADGALIVMVTHFVTISALTGLGVNSAEGVLMRLDGKGGITVLDRLGFALSY